MGAVMTFLKQRVSTAIWELLLLLAFVIIFASLYRIYFSRAVALTQVCEKIAAFQSSNSDALKGDAGDSLNDINELCQIRRPQRP
jgi:hypothetical protein